MAAEQGIVGDDPLWLMLAAVVKAESAADHSAAILAEIKTVLAQQSDILKASTHAALLASVDEIATQMAQHLAQPNRRFFEIAYQTGRQGTRIQALTAALLAMTVAACVGMIFGSVRWDIAMPEKFSFVFNAPLGFLLIAQLAGLMIFCIVAFIGKRN
jgi:hypothetical protein